MKQDDELQPQLQPEKERQEPAPRQAGINFMAIAASIALGVALLTFHVWSGPSAPMPAFEQNTQRGDNVSFDKRAQIDGYYAAYTGKLLPLDPEQVKASFMASPQMSESDKVRLWAAVEDGKARLAVVTLWDNFDEDGDAVSVQSEGVTVNVPLLHAPTQIYIPYKPGGSVSITGLHDGGGGVTAAIETSAGAVPLPIMSVGQTIVLPLL